MVETLNHTRNWKFATVTYALLFAFSVFFQCVAFNYLAFRSLPIECIINAPKVFWGFFLPKISISLLFAAFVFVFKRKKWTIIFSTVISLWCLAELIYYRINGILLDEYSFTMIGNMNGFWSSIITFVFPLDLVLLCPVILVCLTYIFFNSEKRSITGVSVLLLFSIVSQCIGTYCSYRESQKPEWFTPNGRSEMRYNPLNKHYLGFDPITHARFTSTVHCIISDLWYLSTMPFSSDNNKTLEESDRIKANQFFCESNVESAPSTKLIVIVFESLENWSISEKTTPNILKLINHSDNILWARKITSQIIGGSSGDGQMIINTGLLPISEGAACFLFSRNTYPSFGEMFQKTAMIQAGEMSVWNQAEMSKAYHINDNIVNLSEDDAVSTKRLNEIYDDYSYVQMLTMASHAPFKKYSEKKSLTFNSDMPLTMQHYLNCVHYTDSCLAEFLSKINTDENLKKATIVITADHKIFNSDMHKTFYEYSCSHNEYLNSHEPYCPLIIYSPNIKKKTIIDEVAYQMDIFPTVLHLIGCGSTYYWKGFGKNLLNSEECRRISPEEAFILSDKMIRANYWNTYKKEHNIH